MNFQTESIKKQLLVVDFTCTIQTHRLCPWGYVIIPKPYFSSREGTISHCRNFDLLHFSVLAQSDAARPDMIAVVAAHVRCRWRSIDSDRRTMASRCCIQINIGTGDSAFSIVFGVFRV